MSTNRREWCVCARKIHECSHVLLARRRRDDDTNTCTCDRHDHQLHPLELVQCAYKCAPCSIRLEHIDTLTPTELRALRQTMVKRGDGAQK
jgi:hypothetical protein